MDAFNRNSLSKDVVKKIKQIVVELSAIKEDTTRLETLNFFSSILSNFEYDKIETIRQFIIDTSKIKYKKLKKETIDTFFCLFE